MKMPRVSKKAQLASQLQDMWLACGLSNTVIDDLDLLQQILSSAATHRKNNYHGHDWPYAGGSGGLLRGGEKRWLNWANPEIDLRMEESEEDEEEEVIGFLGIIISQVRYLAPRMPILHSEYLFTHYVSELYFMGGILKNNKSRKGKILT